MRSDILRDPVNRRKHQNDARPLGLCQHAAQPEDHAALVLSQDLDRGDQVNHDDQDDYQRWKVEHD